MIVICKKGTKKLIKGHRYEVDCLYNGTGNQRWQQDKITLKGIVGRFQSSHFTDTDGKELPKINIIKSPVDTYKKLEFDNLKKGDILICDTDTYTTFTKGCMYKVVDLLKTSVEKKSWNGSKYIQNSYFIKFAGVSRWIKFSSWNFRSLTPEEQREIQLNSLLLDKAPPIVLPKESRGINLVLNKQDTLIKIICQSVLDTNRHHLGVIDWSCEKTGHKLKVRPEDFSELLEMKLEDVLKLIDKK